MSDVVSDEILHMCNFIIVLDGESYNCDYHGLDDDDGTLWHCSEVDENTVIHQKEAQ